MRKRHFIRLFFICIILVIFSISISQSSLAYEKEIKRLASTISENIVKANKKTIAVTDFVDLQGNVNELGRFIAEELSVDLLDVAKGFEVIDRTHLKSIMAEHKLSMSGIVDPKTVKKLGRITGVDAIVTGSVTPFGDSIRVSCKVIATDTARVIGATKGDIPKTKAIEELLARGIETRVEATTPVRPAPPVKALQRVEAKGFLFELQSCKLSGGALTCYMVITNKEKDRELSLSGNARVSHWDIYPSRAFDDFGNEYVVDRVSLSNKNDAGCVNSMLVSGVSTKATLSFEGFSPEAKMISLLEIKGNLGGGVSIRVGGNFCHTGPAVTVQLRNIPLSR